MYYAQAWAFIHYLMHGEHAARFKQYLKALQKGDANLLEYLSVSERDLETGFQNYMKFSIQRSTRAVGPRTICTPMSSSVDPSRLRNPGSWTVSVTA